ncbi:MAG: glycosyltransferase family 2 protein [Selenomonadaceae bacterium]|nr:glycosyltransferase family 2 protein [Selenomonadaceae bacterium]
MSDEKLITVITTVYNKAQYLETWAVSVASQTYLSKARIIVIDDGSTDDSVALIQKYAAKYGIPVEIFVHEKNCGLLRTILDAYHLLDTKYFTVLDADDYWLSERKLEKAVTFLEAHEDYTIYASNYLKENIGEKSRIGFPMDLPNQTFVSADEMAPYHFQTIATVFRNFFTPELLTEMERVSRGRKVHVCETDPFRNFLAFHFGKAYFENSLDAAWRSNIGAYGTLTDLEKALNIMQEHWQMFEFYKKNFGKDKNAAHALNLCVLFYLQSADIFANMLKHCTLFEFRGGKYFRDRFFDYGETDVDKIVNALLEQTKLLRQIGFRLVE